jgi:hypothetical protein
MPVEQAIQALLQILSQNPDTAVLVVAEPEDDVVIQRLSITDELATDFFRIAQDASNRLTGDLELRPYVAGYIAEPHQLCYLSLEEHPEIAETVNQLSQVQQAELFAEDEDVIDSLRFYAIVIASQATNQALFFREYGPKRELSRKGGIAALFSAGSYNRIDTNIFLFDAKVDCFVCGGYLFINNLAAFQRIFKFFEAVKAKADETLDAILGQIPVFNADQFRIACKGQIQMVAKLLQISRRPYLAQVTMNDLRQTISDYHLDVEIKDVEGKEHLVFDTAPNKRWIILKLLDDGYLGSTMTKLKYEVNSKSPLA